MKTPIELSQTLTQYEDAESAIAVYKEVNFIISQYEVVKKAALALAESELRSTGESNMKTTLGSCGWTQPKVAHLDKEAWEQAIKANSAWITPSAGFDRVKAAIETAQRPFMEVPEGRFFIK